MIKRSNILFELWNNFENRLPKMFLYPRMLDVGDILTSQQVCCWATFVTDAIALYLFCLPCRSKFLNHIKIIKITLVFYVGVLQDNCFKSSNKIGSVDIIFSNIHCSECS